MAIFQRTPKVPFDAAFFDADGTMIDSEKWFTEAFKALLANRGHKYSDIDRTEVTGLQATDACELIVRYFGLDDTPEGLFIEWRDMARKFVFTQGKVCPGVKDVLKIMEKRKIPKLVVTAASHEYAVKILTKLKLLRRFKGMVSRDTVHNQGLRTKPAPDPYLFAARWVGVHPSRCIVFEDSAHGVVSAKQAGCYVVGIYNNETKVGKVLRQAGADIVLPSLVHFRERFQLLR